MKSRWKKNNAIEDEAATYTEESQTEKRPVIAMPIRKPFKKPLSISSVYY